MARKSAVYRNEELLWIPKLESHGFQSTCLATDRADKLFDHDLIAISPEGKLKSFSVRTRNVDGNYSNYVNEITIRHSFRCLDQSQWHKLFESPIENLPDYFCYGFNRNNRIREYLIINTYYLRILHDKGCFDKYLSKIKTNVDIGKFTSKFVPINLRDLLKDESIRISKLIPFASKNHPLFIEAKSPFEVSYFEKSISDAFKNIEAELSSVIFQ